jgi:protein-tyrosine phosphatase
MSLLSWLGSPRLTPRHVGYDVHSHLLPGVDDGVHSAKDALECLQGLAAMGFAGAVITPHIYPEVFDNREKDLRAKFHILSAQAHQAVPDFALHLAAEYFLHDGLFDRVRSAPEELLLFGRGNALLLVELPKAHLPANLEGFFDGCARRAIVPVIAHVDRYGYFQSNLDLTLLQAWRKQGALLQVNTGSLAGHYGPGPAQVARRLWAAGLVDLVGSDLHDPAHLPQLADGWAWIGRRAGRFDAPAQRRALGLDP